MKAKIFTSALISGITTVLVVFFNPFVFGQTQGCLQNLNHPGYNTISQVTSSETIVREYILHIPKNYDSESPTPIVINLHGFGDCASDFAETVGDFYKFNELADLENIITVYPQGAYRPEKEDTYWEPGDSGVQDIFKNDIYFIEQLVTEIGLEYNVDMNRVYAIGYSNGGMMVYSLACNSSNLISGVGIMSGVMLEEECTLENSVPIIAFHGIADDVLPYAGNIWYQSVSDVINFWLDQNNIDSNSLISTTLNNGNAVLDEYLNGDENSCLQLYTVHQEFDKPGGHVWFSEAIEGISPNSIIWNFFNDNCGLISATENYPDLNLKIEPNPFIDRITISANSLLGQSFSIYTLQGNHKISGTMTTNPYTIDLVNLTPNIYIFNIGGNMRKLIKTE